MADYWEDPVFKAAETAYREATTAYIAVIERAIDAEVRARFPTATELRVGGYHEPDAGFIVRV